MSNSDNNPCRLFDDWLAHNEERVIQSAMLAHQLINEAISLSDSQTAAFKVALTVRYHTLVV